MSHFFAYLARMKFIQRWGLMNNTSSENIEEHSLQVAMIAHALAIIRNEMFEGDVNPERVAVLALFHDASEVITGDLPTPIKYFNPQINVAFKEIETIANQKLLDMVPDPLKAHYRSLLQDSEEDRQHHELVKAADKICAYLKCVKEVRVGNLEFSKAEKELKTRVEGLGPEVAYFLETFLPSFRLTLDELD